MRPPSLRQHATLPCASEHGSGGCFVQGTKAHSKDGKEPIEYTQIGDDVLSAAEYISENPNKRKLFIALCIIRLHNKQ